MINDNILYCTTCKKKRRFYRKLYTDDKGQEVYFWHCVKCGAYKTAPI